MDNAAIIALSTALEIEFEGLRRQLTSISKEQDPQRFENQVNSLIDHLPSLLASMAVATYSRTVWEGLLATAYAEGVGKLAPVRISGRLLRASTAYAAIEQSHALADAVNALNVTKEAITVRAEALAKVVKGHLVQDLRHMLMSLDQQGVEESRQVVAEQASKLEDLTSNPHVAHQVESQMQLAEGYGIFSVQQKDAFLRAMPFQEFYRVEHRVEWRPWPGRWAEQGGQFFPGPSDYPEGRMIAETGSAIWEHLASYPDGTGQPYPPFAWNSGMGVKPVGVEEGKKLGLYGAHHRPPKPKKLDFNAGIKFSADFDDDIKSALLDSMQDWAEQKDEIYEKA